MKFTTLILLLLIYRCYTNNEGEIQARELIQKYQEYLAILKRKQNLAVWNYMTNITEENLNYQMKVSNEVLSFEKYYLSLLGEYNWIDFQDPLLRRQFEVLNMHFIEAPDEVVSNIKKIKMEMTTIYSTAKLCSYRDRQKCNLTLDQDIEDIFRISQDPEELKYYWEAWRNVSGRKMKNLYETFTIEYKKKHFTENMKKEMYLKNDHGFQTTIKNLWKKVKPLYKDIHKYVHRKLRQKYGRTVVPNDSYIPAHLLGNIWAQTWSNIYNIVAPFPDIPIANITKEMIAQNYTIEKIFKTAEEFYISINMSAMTEAFWKYSMLEKPIDREVVCHASAWDFNNGKDYRIKQCTKIRSKYFYITHHEMGHIEYFMQYKDQPYLFRDGANQGFEEAVGDVIGLSVSTQKHLHKIGLVDSYEESYENTINKQMEMALRKIAFLPFAIIMDLWRWEVLNNNLEPENFNSMWWKLRKEYQKIEPPVPRTKEDFDPGAKFHILKNTPYIRLTYEYQTLTFLCSYFVSYIIQFQWHKALCTIAGEYEAGNPNKPLHNCDIYRNTKAGNALKSMLQKGSSLSWQDAMEQLTGERNMDASGILEYFAPLQKWLIENNNKFKKSRKMRRRRYKTKKHYKIIYRKKKMRKHKARRTQKHHF